MPLTPNEICTSSPDSSLRQGALEFFQQLLCFLETSDQGGVALQRGKRRPRVAPNALCKRLDVCCEPGPFLRGTGRQLQERRVNRAGQRQEFVAGHRVPKHLT